MDPVLDALWKRVLDHWDDEAAHGAFLEHCQRANLLVEAAVRYRGMKADRQRGPIAEQRLVAVATLAMAELEGARSPRRAEPSQARHVTLIVLFSFATAALLAYVWTAR